MNREAWLQKAVKAMTPRLVETFGSEMPSVHVSVGWPGGGSNREVTIGQCWPTTATADEVSQIFVSPIQGEADTQQVLAVILHEMIHAIDDCASGHRAAFARTAKALGFIPPLTSVAGRSEALNDYLDEIAGQIGLFPHATINANAAAADTPKKQSTRMIKIICPDDGYVARTSRKWLDDLGAPTCPCGTQMEEAT